MQEHDNKEFLKTGKVNDHSKIVTCKSVLGRLLVHIFFESRIRENYNTLFPQKMMKIFFHSS